MLPTHSHTTAYTILGCAYLGKSIQHGDAGDLTAAAVYLALGPGESAAAVYEYAGKLRKSAARVMRRANLKAVGGAIVTVAAMIAMMTPLR